MRLLSHILFCALVVTASGPAQSASQTHRADPISGNFCGAAFARFAPIDQPPVLVHVPNSRPTKVRNIDRLRKAAMIFDVSDGNHPPLPTLPDNFYIYAIDTKDHLVVLERTLDPSPARFDVPGATFLGSHDGIALVLKDAYRTEPKLVAAGEFIIRNGRVTMFSNKSGSYPGGEKHLEYARKKMDPLGFDIKDDKDIYRDFSKQDDVTKRLASSHATDEAQALRDLDARRNPVTMELLRETKDVMLRFDRKFPDAVKIPALMIQSTSDYREQTRLLEAMALRGEWLAPNASEAYLVDHWIQALGPASVHERLVTLRRYIDKAH